MTRTALVALIAAVAIGILAGVAFDAWWRPAPADSSRAAPGTAEAGRADLAAIVARLEALNKALDEERSLRGALELELALLRQELVPADATAGAVDASPGEPAPPSASKREAAEPPSRAAFGRKDWFDEAALRQSGLDEQRSAWLRERFETLQMEELYLRDQAAREGWLNKPRHRDELRQLRDETQESLGSSDYDWLLYASGRNNRVLVNDVLQSSPAAAAGIQPGDLILRYDEVAVLSLRDLTTATTQGQLGAGVTVEVQRDGDVQRLTVSRGPLGARISAVRRPPLSEH